MGRSLLVSTLAKAADCAESRLIEKAMELPRLAEVDSNSARSNRAVGHCMWLNCQRP